MDDLGETAQPLNEFTKEEWFDVGRICNPSLTWAEFQEMWDEHWANKQRLELN